MANDAAVKPVVFLVFANDPEDRTGFLRHLRNEAEELRDLLETAGKVCEVVVRQNASLKNILDVFQNPKYKHRIAIFHFGGHANSYQLLLESAEGKAMPASAAGLAAFLAQQRGLHLVFLNGCATGEQAQGLLDAGIKVVIATDRKINDNVAVEFAARFYQGLATGDDIPAAFATAQGASQAGLDDDVTRAYLDEEDFGDTPPNTWPWHLYPPELPEEITGWNLSKLANDLYWVMPPLPPNPRLPNKPFLGLSYFREKHAHIFFGRGLQILELFNLITNESLSTNPIILLYGQSGVGKSSLLAAGLLPRLKQVAQVRYIRREDAGNNLTAALQRALERPSPQPSSTGRGSQITSPPLGGIEGGEESQSFINLWLAQETEDRPLVIIIDQVEEIYTRPNGDPRKELTTFLDALQSIFSDDVDPWPQGKLILGFRKEWLADIEDPLKAKDLPYKTMFLKHLDQPGIIEAITGPATSLKAQYDLVIADEEPGEVRVPEAIARDLLKDRGSAIAPTLQIILTKMWDNATGSPKRFSQELYHNLQLKQANFLGQLLDQQLAELAHDHPKESASGLVLDLLTYHTTELGTTQQRNREELEAAYCRQINTLPGLVQSCKDRYLLVDPGGAEDEEAPDATRLSHDTLGPLVRARFVGSQKPGQKAYRLLQNRIPDWQHGKTGPTLQEEDLTIVEKGLDGMRAWDDDEQRLVAASGEARDRRRKSAKNRRMYFFMGLSAMVVLVMFINIIFVLWQASKKERLRSEASRLMAEGGGNSVTLDNPLLGLRLVLEAWYLVPDNEYKDEELREKIGDSILDLMSQGRISNLGNDIESIITVPDSDTFIIDYRSQVATIYDPSQNLANDLPGQLDRVEFLPEANLYWVRYNDALPEMRRIDGESLIMQFPAPIEWIEFSPDGRFFVAYYVDNIPLEIRRTEDGEIVAALPNHRELEFSPDGETFLAHYPDASYELRRTEDGNVIASFLPEETFLSFSPDGRFFFVDLTYTAGYYDDKPILDFYSSELRRTKNNTPVVQLSGPVANISFSPDGQFFVVGYLDDTPSELHRIEDGELVTTFDALDTIQFSKDGRFVVIDYSNGTPAELRRIEDGSIIKTFSAAVNEIAFSPDEANHFIVLNYSDNALTELRRTEDGAEVELSGPIHGVEFFSGEIGDRLYAVNYSDDTLSELRRIEDDSIVTSFPNRIKTIRFDQGIENGYFFVEYQNGRMELWNGGLHNPQPLLADLGFQNKFTSEPNQLITLFNNGQAYLLNLDWVQLNSEKFSVDELITEACRPFEIFFSKTDQDLLAEYLPDDVEPTACVVLQTELE